MKVSELSFIALRIFAIYVIYNGITQLVNVYYVGVPGWLEMDELNFNVPLMIILFSIPTILILGIGIALWFFARRLSDKLANKRDMNDRSDADFQFSYNMVISLAGLIIVIFSVVNLIRDIPTMMDYNQFELNPLSRQHVYQVIAEAVKLLFGLGLLIKANTIRRLIQTLIEKNK